MIKFTAIKQKMYFIFNSNTAKFTYMSEISCQLNSGIIYINLNNLYYTNNFVTWSVDILIYSEKYFFVSIYRIVHAKLQ